MLMSDSTPIDCGPPTLEDPIAWHQIDWRRCQREVRRLQARIVAATKTGRYGKVKALQWLLTHSFCGKALAVRRVTENRGKRTPGVDGETWSSPEAKAQAIQTLKRQNYRPQPLRRIYIPKANGKQRPLGIPTIKDRALQALYLLALEPVTETTADRRSYGFRPERSTADAIEQCFRTLCRRTSPEWVLEGDIKGCFDNISHPWLLDNTPMDTLILKKWLKAGYLEKQILYPTEAGTPQGGVISATLMNLTLDGLEAKLEDAFGGLIKRHGRLENRKVNFIRYADDFIVTGCSRELLEQHVTPFIEAFMKERGLALSPEKTKITHIDEGFDFLGCNLKKYNDKLLIKPSKKNVAAFLKKIRSTIKDHKAISQHAMIKLLNPMIRGWANYHQHIVAKRVFAQVDYKITYALWQWATRRHPNKCRDWVYKRYFHAIDSKNWVFAAPTGTKTPDGEPNLTCLWRAVDTPIVRHVPIKMTANPFDPEWEVYFEERAGNKMKRSLRTRKQLLKLWISQEQRCPVCKTQITLETGWHVHHIQRRVDGGQDNPGNLIMLHPNCHRQIHASVDRLVYKADLIRDWSSFQG
jgi:RNA-directed DNA polymerase